MTAKFRTFLIFTVLFITGCEKSFEPLAPSEFVFSIYGHLDAAADTQWVRVMPLRQSLATQPNPIDATVTLEEIESGATVVMGDSLSRYLPLFLGDTEVYAHNFWTTMPIVPGRHYRLTVTRSDGATARATVLIPKFDSPTLKVDVGTGQPKFGSIKGTRHLAMVLGREDIPASCGLPFTIHQEYLRITRPAMFDGEDHAVLLSWDLPFERPQFVPHPPGDCNLGPKRILVLASGEPWPYSASTALRELSHLASINNVEGRGVGFLGGIQTHVFPYAVCVPIERATPCTITFSPRSAALTGVVTNGCTGGPMGNLLVRLDSPATNGIRYDTTDVSGAFTFEGLEPGSPNSVAVSQQVIPGRLTPVDIVDFFAHQMENVVFAEGARDPITIEMVHRRNCMP